jgi:hypothetical protein
MYEIKLFKDFNLQLKPLVIDWDPDLQVMSVFDPTPQTYKMGVKVTDILDETTWHYFDLIVNANNPPAVTAKYAPYTTKTHTLTSGQHFCFDFPHDFFTDPDAGDQIERWFMDSADGTHLPTWISFLPHSHTYTGTANEIATAATYTLRIWAYDTRGAQFSVNVIFIINPNLEPVLNNPLLDKYVINAEAFFMI